MANESSNNKIAYLPDGEPLISQHLNAKACALGLPVSGTFELTSRCNFNCKMCYVHSQKNPEELRSRELSVEQWLEIGKQARDAGLMFLLLTGGEPLLRPDFPELYTGLCRLGLMVSINTNASLYNEQIHELFKKYPPIRINVTLYGASEETYQNLCGNPSFARVVANVKKMKEDGLSVRLNCSLTQWNVADMEGIAKIAGEIGLHVKATTYMYPPVRVEGEDTPAENRLSAEEAGRAQVRWKAFYEPEEMFRRHVEQAKALDDLVVDGREPWETDEDAAQAAATDTDHETDLGTCSDPEGECISCRAARSSFWLKWDGEMVVCGTMGIEGTNVLKTGFLKAWEQTRQIGAQIHLPIECKNCKYRPLCGACASVSKCETGAFGTRPDYMCRYTKSMVKEMCKLAEIIGKD